MDPQKSHPKATSEYWSMSTAQADSYTLHQVKQFRDGQGTGQSHGFSSWSRLSRTTEFESRGSGTERDLCPIEYWDKGTVPGLGGILVPICRDLLSRTIIVPGLFRRFLSRSRMSRSIESRSRFKSRGFPGTGSRYCPGKNPLSERIYF